MRGGFGGWSKIGGWSERKGVKEALKGGCMWGRSAVI